MLAHTKDYPIFLHLARKFPHVEFGAVVSWGTTDADVKAMEEYPNIRVLNTTSDMDEIYRQTRVLLRTFFMERGIWHGDC